MNITFEHCVIESSFGDASAAMIQIRRITNLNMEHNMFENKMIEGEFEMFNIERYKDTKFNLKPFAEVLPARDNFYLFADIDITQIFHNKTTDNQRGVFAISEIGNSIMNNCTFQSLRSSSIQAGILSVGSSEMTIKNSLFFNNYAVMDLGATTTIFDNAVVTLRNVTFLNNVAGTAPAIKIERTS